METQKQPSLNELVQERVQQAVTSIPVRLRRIDRRKGYTLEELEDVFEMRISENLLSYLEEKHISLGKNTNDKNVLSFKNSDLETTLPSEKMFIKGKPEK